MHYCSDALGQEVLAVGLVLSLPLEHSQGCVPSLSLPCPQSSRQVGLDNSSELQSNINVPSIMGTTGGFYVGSPALQDA